MALPQKPTRAKTIFRARWPGRLTLLNLMVNRPGRVSKVLMAHVPKNLLQLGRVFLDRYQKSMPTSASSKRLAQFAASVTQLTGPALGEVGFRFARAAVSLAHYFQRRRKAGGLDPLRDVIYSTDPGGAPLGPWVINVGNVLGGFQRIAPYEKTSMS